MSRAMKYKLSKKFAYLKYIKKKGKCKRCGGIINAKYDYCFSCKLFVERMFNNKEVSGD